jgi:pyruvate formate lyase activating enzyme
MKKKESVNEHRPGSGPSGFPAALAVFIINIAVAVALITALPAYFNQKTFIEHNPAIKEAMFYHNTCNGVQCDLCPAECFLPEGFRGKCRVRINTGDKLYTMVYGLAGSTNVDPIEKKPIFHLKPGSTAYSIATNGCNLRCAYCQNWQLSQSNPENPGYVFMPPEKIVELAKYYKSSSVAYTYSDPVIFYEYMYDTAKLARQNGLYNIMITAGYINREPLEALLPYLDMVKVDFKGFNDRFYRTIVGCDLSDILNTLRTLKKHNVSTELVNLVVPGLNDNMDDLRKLCKWVVQNMGADTPLFFTKFYPQYRLLNLPPTSEDMLVQVHDMAKQEGLEYVYVGNVPGNKYENTFCPRCGRVVVGRRGYTITEYNITSDGKCKFCGYKIHGIW